MVKQDPLDEDPIDEDPIDEDSSIDFFPGLVAIDREQEPVKRRNVLVIEDDIVDYKLVSCCLKTARGVDYRKTRAASLSEGLDRLDEGGIDIVLLDLNLPDSRGLETFQKVRFHAPEVPIIVLSGSDDESLVIEAARAGAQDYLVKGKFDADLLLRSIHYSRARHRSRAKVQEALQRLQRSESNLRNVLTSSIDGIVVVDNQGTLSFSNPAAEALFGRSADELPITDIGFPLTAGILTETDIVRSDGQHVPVEVRVAEMSWEGRATYLVVLRDLTSQKRAEVERAQLAAIVQSTEDAIFSVDIDGVILSWNLGAEKVFGYSSDEAIGKHVWILPAPDRHADALEIHEKAKRGEVVSQYDIVGVRKDGRKIHTSVSLNPMRNAQGEVVSIAAILRDVTKRKRAELELRESEERYRDLFDNASDLIQSVAPDGSLIYVNPAWKETLGYTDEDVDNLDLFDIIHPDSRAHCQELFQRVASGEYLEHIEATFVTRDGRSIDVEGSSSCKFEDGKPVATRGQFRDVTERRQAQRAQEALRERQVQLEAAQEIQKRLLPQTPPTLPGFDIAGALSPAELVAGDYFDYLPMIDGSMAIAVGDVSGHGFGPALLMAATSAHLRSLVQVSDNVQEILGLLNQALAARTVGEHFVTFLLARLDYQGHSLSYSSAGHPDGYVLDASGDVKARLESTGLPLAITLDAEFPMGISVKLDPGDTVVMLSDGFIEASSAAGKQFGTERVLDVVRANRSKTAEGIIASLYQTVQEFSGQGTQRDDLTAVVVKLES